MTSTSSKNSVADQKKSNNSVTVKFQEKRKKDKEKPNDSTGAYLQEIGRKSLLTGEEEIKYAQMVKRLREIKDTESRLEQELRRKAEETEVCKALGISAEELRERKKAGYLGREILIERNLKLVVSIAKKYRNQGMSFQSLIQEGSIGLIKGVEKFDPAKGYRLSTYIFWWIRQGITRGIAEKSRQIRLPVHISELLSRKDKAYKVLSQKLGRTPSRKELAEEMGITIEKLNNLLEKTRTPISLDLKVGELNDSTLEEVIVDETNESPEEVAIKSETKDRVIKLIEQAELTQQEKDVIRLRFGLDDGNCLSGQKIGSILNLSRQRVNQIEKDAIGKLKKASANQMSKAREATSSQPKRSR